MQNPLAALMMPTLPAEAASSTVSLEPGDGSFAETFVEADNASEPTLLSQYAGGSDFVVPLFWPTMTAPRPAFLVATGASVGIEMHSFDQPAVLAGSNLPLQVVEGDAEGTMLDPRFGKGTPGDGSTHLSVSVELSAAYSESASSLAAVVRPVLSGNPAELSTAKYEISSAPASLATTPENQTALLPAITLATAPKSDSNKPDTHGLKQTPVGRPSSEDAATVAQPKSTLLLEGDLSPLPDSHPTLVGVISNQPNVQVTVPGQFAMQPQSDGHPIPLLERVSVGHIPPMWQMGPPDAGTAEVTKGQPSHISAAADAGLKLQTEEWPDLSPVVTLSQVHDLGAEPREISSSFWERFFSDHSISAPYHVRKSASGVSPSEIVSPLATSVFPVLTDTSEPFAASSTSSDPQPLTDASFRGLEEAVKQPGILPETAVAPTATVDGFIGIAQSEMVIAGWEEALAQLGDGADLLQSHGLASSVRASAGVSMSPSSLPALPVPQVAAQLAGVLVRSPGTVTELALSPEELGHVRLRMEPDAANPDRMLILISVERPETLELFRRHAGELAEAIRSAGYSGADIGFGQNGKEGSPEHRKEQSSAGPHLPFDETGHIEPIQMLPPGASLDLRL